MLDIAIAVGVYESPLTRRRMATMALSALAITVGMWAYLAALLLVLS